MAAPSRRSDVVAQDLTQVFFGVAGGCVGVILGLLAFRYVPTYMVVGAVFMIAGAVGFAVAAFKFYQTTQVPSFTLTCPYCARSQVFTAPPMDDVSCGDCNRLIHLEDGRILPVVEIDCPHCHAVNYYSKKTRRLFCESCSKEIPLPQLATASQNAALQQAMEDTRDYEVVLVASGGHPEQVLDALQRLLSLTRPQVKKTLETLPAALFSGIKRHRAELIRNNLMEAGAQVEIRPVE